MDLLSLLLWKSTPNQIGEILDRISKVEGAEIVKFLQDVLDALFGMFSTEDGNSTQHSGHVFQALVSICYLILISFSNIIFEMKQMPKYLDSKYHHDFWPVTKYPQQRMLQNYTQCKQNMYPTCYVRF